MGSNPTSPTMKRLTLGEQDFKKIFRTQTPSGKLLKFIWRLSKQLLGLAALFLFFFVILNYAAYLKRFEFSVAPPVVQPIPVVVLVPSEPLPNYSPKLQISKIGLDAPIVMNIGISDVIPNLVNGVVQLSGSATPGQNGNLVIFGHSSDFPWSNGHYKNIFALLDKLSAGDQIAIPYQSQIFTYTVASSRVVKPTEIGVINKTDLPTLTLITCYPVGTATNRLIVTANLKNGQTTGTQIANPSTESLPTSR